MANGSQLWPMGANRGLWEPMVAYGSQPWPMEPIMASQAHQMGLPVPPQCQIVILETPSAPPVTHRPPQCQIVILETPQCPPSDTQTPPLPNGDPGDPPVPFQCQMVILETPQCPPSAKW